MILLDTCTLLWLVGAQAEISEKALLAVKKNKGSLYVSAISAFEIGIKVKKKKLKLPKKVEDWFSLALQLHGIKELEITSDILISSVQLPLHHTDPADRIIIATASHYNLTILTPDDHMKKYSGINVVW